MEGKVRAFGHTIGTPCNLDANEQSRELFEHLWSKHAHCYACIDGEVFKLPAGEASPESIEASQVRRSAANYSHSVRPQASPVRQRSLMDRILIVHEAFERARLQGRRPPTWSELDRLTALEPPSLKAQSDADTAASVNDDWRFAIIGILVGLIASFPFWALLAWVMGWV